MLDYHARRKAANDRWLARKEQIAEMKAMATDTIRFKTPETKKRTETIMVDGEPMAMEELDSRAFKAYVTEVESVLKANDGLMTIRKIKAALGDRLVERWLMDALSMSYHVLHVPAFIDRFAYVDEISVEPVAPNKNIQVAGTAKHKGPDWPAS